MPLATQQSLNLEVHAPDEPLYAFMDRASLSRIINNLVGNAIKFTKTGGVVVEVAAGNGSGEETDSFIFRVRDTGIGIDPDFLPHVFDEFKQASGDIGSTHKGAGLGLSITKRLVELMGGSIEVESREGEGSVFTVTLPVSIEATELPEGLTPE
jgi:signal transduction histidine kinase